MSVGCLGVIEGLDRFDPGLGWRVSTYCLWWVRNAIGYSHLREVRWQSAVNEGDYKLIVELHRVLSKKPVRFDGHVDFAPLAEELKIDEDECHRLYVVGDSMRSLKTPTSRNGKVKLGDNREGKDKRSREFKVKAHELATVKLQEGIAALPDREKRGITGWDFDRPCPRLHPRLSAV